MAAASSPDVVAHNVVDPVVVENPECVGPATDWNQNLDVTHGWE